MNYTLQPQKTLDNNYHIVVLMSIKKLTLFEKLIYGNIQKTNQNITLH